MAKRQAAKKDHLKTADFTSTSRGQKITTSVHTIDPSNPESMALLAQAYNDVYMAAFPIDAERESLDSWVKSLTQEDSSSAIVITIAGENLDDLEGRTVKALSVGYYYADTNAGLLAYNAVDPAFQGQGLGRIMVEARERAMQELAQQRGKTLGGTFVECNDPAKINPDEDVMDPKKRIAIFEGMGARVLNIDYVQPPLQVGGEKCDTLKLLAYPNPVTGKYPTKDEVRDYLTGIYTELAEYAGCPPEKNPDFIRSMKQLEALPEKDLILPPTKQNRHKPSTINTTPPPKLS